MPKTLKSKGPGLVWQSLRLCASTVNPGWGQSLVGELRSRMPRGTAGKTYTHTHTHTHTHKTQRVWGLRDNEPRTSLWLCKEVTEKESKQQIIPEWTSLSGQGHRRKRKWPRGLGLTQGNSAKACVALSSCSLKGRWWLPLALLKLGSIREGRRDVSLPTNSRHPGITSLW